MKTQYVTLTNRISGKTCKMALKSIEGLVSVTSEQFDSARAKLGKGVIAADESFVVMKQQRDGTYKMLDCVDARAIGEEVAK